MKFAPAEEMNELNEYVFVARARIDKYIDMSKKLDRWETLDKKTSNSMFYIDIKSKKLRDILRTVLHNIHDVFLRKNKPQIWLSVFLHKSLTYSLRLDRMKSSLSVFFKIESISNQIERRRLSRDYEAEAS